MRTEKQIEASRRNGAKSKGPITEEGKAISSLNGTTHGLSGGHRFLYNNERDDLYLELFAHYQKLFNPANGVEEDLVRQIVTASWRMKRIETIEAATVDVQMDRQRKWVDKEYKAIDNDTRLALAFQTNTVSDTVALAGRYHARALRCFNSAYKILRELQRDRLKAESVRSLPETQQPVQDIPVSDTHHLPTDTALSVAPESSSPPCSTAKPQDPADTQPADTACSYEPNPTVLLWTDCNLLETQLT
jgi:hypothetical protein